MQPRQVCLGRGCVAQVFSTTPSSVRQSLFALFCHRDFAHALDGDADLELRLALVQAVGAAWMMTQRTDLATLIALVQASNTLPIGDFRADLGALADIFDRKTLLLAAQAFMAVVSVLLAVLTWQGWMTPVLLLSLTF